MFECTVKIDGEDESSYFGVTSQANAMEMALWRYAYLPWCKKRVTPHITELELTQAAKAEAKAMWDNQETKSCTISARAQVISEIRAKIAARDSRLSIATQRHRTSRLFGVVGL